MPSAASSVRQGTGHRDRYRVPRAVALAATCEELMSLSLPDTTISSAESVPAGTAPAHCRVAGVIKPTTDSNILFEVWLPAAGWNSKLMQVGNGGLAGDLTLFQAAAPGALQRGYAVAGTDDGHQASPLDASWAIGHPELVKDFGYRAVHLTNVNARKITEAFYSSAPRYTYFNACSEGGREAHVEAQRFPGDFDGMLVGSPAHFWTDLMVRFQWDQHALLIDPASYIPASKLPALQAAAVAACDDIDGVVDGIVDDPRKCKWDPSAITCTGADSDSCLTVSQVDALKKIYAGPTNRRTGEQISTGYERSGENSGNWIAYIIGMGGQGSAAQQLFSVAFYSGMVYEDPTWDFKTFDFDADVAFAEMKVGAILNATNPDMSAFQRRGAKMIQYHGWIDASPHPRGGPGPNVFGQLLAAPPPSSDASHDALTALEQWVEHGKAPEKIIATKYVSDNPANGIAMQRPLCPYPQVARWKGTGDTNDATNFVCADEEMR